MKPVVKLFVLCFALGIFVFPTPRSLLRAQSDFAVLDSDDGQEDLHSPAVEPVVPVALPQPCFVGPHEFSPAQFFPIPRVLPTPASRSPPRGLS